MGDTSNEVNQGTFLKWVDKGMGSRINVSHGPSRYRAHLYLNRWYNFGRVHKSLRVTPAMAAGIADHIWSVRELLEAA